MSGCVEGQPRCCGDWTESGECRGYCAVPMQCEGCEECRPEPPRDEERDTQPARLPGGAD